MDVERVLQTAIEQHDLGKLGEAAKLCSEVLAIEPDNALAFHLLGLIAVKQGNGAKALDLIGKSLQINSSDSVALMNYGNVLGELGESDRALISYESAVLADSRNWQAWNCRGALLHQLARFTEAIESFLRALSIEPNNPATLTNLGLSYRSVNLFEDAITSFDKAIAISPFYMHAVINRAALQSALGEYSGALAGLNVNALDDESNFKLLLGRAIALKGLQQFDKAIAACDQALALNKYAPEAWNVRGAVYFEAGNSDEALASYRQALDIKPDFNPALTGRGAVLLERGDLEGAIKALDAALVLVPTDAHSLWNKAHCLLLQGNFAEGWPLFEWRKGLDMPIEARAYTKPLWTGSEEIAGKTIYLYSVEQGLGDTIQFYRYAQVIQRMGARVILEVQKSVVRLLQSASSYIQIIGPRKAPPIFDYHSPLLSLPWALRTDEASIPREIPYLFSEPDRVKAYTEAIGRRGFKIGINWQGRKGGTIDMGRSIPLVLFKMLSDVPGVRLISLQKNDGTEQLSALPAGMQVETLNRDFDSGPNAFLDTAAAMQCLDLIITSDTSIAHLAGALGRPTWVALRHTPDWRWFLERSDSPWYPTMRLFRQRKARQWLPVFEDMRVELERLIASTKV